MGAGASADKNQLSDATQEALDALPHEVQQELEALLTPRLMPRLCAPAAVLAEDTRGIGGFHGEQGSMGMSSPDELKKALLALEQAVQKLNDLEKDAFLEVRRTVHASRLAAQTRS